MKDIKMQRIRSLLSYLETERVILSQGEFAEMLGVKPSSISEMLTGKRIISEKTIHKIANTFPQVNERWLLTGEGEMLNTELSKMETPPPSDTITMSREIFDKIMKLTDTISSQQETINSQSETIKMLAQRVPVAALDGVAKMAAAGE